MPRAARSEVVGMTTDGAMKVRVAAVPDKGKANEELRDTLADWFKVPKTTSNYCTAKPRRAKFGACTNSDCFGAGAQLPALAPIRLFRLARAFVIQLIWCAIFAATSALAP